MAHTSSGKHNNNPVTVEFSDHALQQMQARGISEQEVLDCISSPSQRGLRANRPDRTRYRRYLGMSGKYVDVVFKKSPPDTIIVVTAMDGP